MMTSKSIASTSTSTSSNKKNVDMSTKVGGRVFYPALDVVDGNEPTELENEFQVTLKTFCSTNIPLETSIGIRTRERVLDKLGTICSQWVNSVAIQKQLPQDVVDNAIGLLYTSGSYRLGVHEPGADIDTIIVTPNYCKRQDFFGTSPNNNKDSINNETQQRDANSLAERIRLHTDVTNFVPVEGAAVPLLTFDWEGINIDLLFARVNTNTLNANDFDIDNDIVLDGADSATEKSLNGPRVTNLIASIASGTKQRYQTFLFVVRCVRKWAKTRGLYSNKMGYWGGVNINIGVALAIQLYPNSCPATLLRKFFLIFKTWRWPQPVMLTKPHDAGYGLPVWTVQQAQIQGGNKANQNVAPMITPAYPAMNSTMSISRQTIQILQEEFVRAHTIVDTIWKDFSKLYQKKTNMKSTIKTPDDDNNDDDVYDNFYLSWNKLFEPSDFFISYPRYLSLCIVGPSLADVQTWAGFVESRLRKLVSDLLCRSLPIKKIQLWPKKFELCVADKNALLTQAQRQNCVTYFIGYSIDKARMRGEQLNVELSLQNFREWDLVRFQPLVPGMDIVVKSFVCTSLPKICFDAIYTEAGKEQAMKKRRLIRNNDPILQEKRHARKLEELKSKMAEIQKKKEDREQQKQLLQQQQQEQEKEQQQQMKEEDAVETVQDDQSSDVKEDDTENTDKKRKRADDDNEDAIKGDDEFVVKPEDIIDDVDAENGTVVENEETNLLENVFNAFQKEEGAVIDNEAMSTTFQDVTKQQQTTIGDDEVNNNDNSTNVNDITTYESDDDEDPMGYIGGGEGARQVYYKRRVIDSNGNEIVNNENDTQQKIQDKRSLPTSNEITEFLNHLNYRFVDDDDMTVLGSNLLPPWKSSTTDSSAGIDKTEDATTGSKSNEDNKNKTVSTTTIPKHCQIQFVHTKFDVIELDPYGRVIDRGDDNFIPSKTYTGRKDGFEFKMNLRGLGYYRTGKPIIVPSNISY